MRLTNLLSKLQYCLLLASSLMVICHHSLLWAETDFTVQVKVEKKSFTIGKVSNNPGKHAALLKPMAQYLAHNMKDLGIVEGDVRIAKDNREMIRLLRQGKVDLVTETPFSATIFTEYAPAKPIAIKWKKGVPSYYSIIFSRIDSGIQSSKDLLGKTLVFEDPGSTSAYMLPMFSLLNQDLKMVRLSAPENPVPQGLVGFVFSYSEQQTSDWVHEGKADAGTISNIDWNKPDHIPLHHKKNYQIIHRSIPISRALEVIRTNLSPDIQERVKHLLLNAHMDPKANYALKRNQKTKRFSAIDEETAQTIELIKSLSHFYEPEL